MPARVTPLVTHEFYHIINRGSASVPIFKNSYDYQRFIQIFLYYQKNNPPIRFSKFNKLSADEKNRALKRIRVEKNFLIQIITYCLMPNHFHFVLKQNKENGIKNFIRLLADSYSRYFNTKYRRKGPLFEGRFKAIRIETDSQLLHLSRYVHLNPYSSYVVKNLQGLINYPFSSLAEYLGKSKEKVCQKKIILDQFANQAKYQEFIFDQADYQRTLEEIKHQVFET